MSKNKTNPQNDELDVLLTYFTYFNDSKFNHIVIFATVLFSQIQIKSLISNNITNTMLLTLALGIYMGIMFFGIYEIFRIKFYVRRTIEFDFAIRRIKPHVFSVQKGDFGKLMGPALYFKNHVLDYTYRVVIIYLLISLAVIFLN